MNWNIKSKRFFVMLVVLATWLVTLITKDELFMALTPYVFGLIAGYMGFESWRPSGLSGTNTGQ